MNYQWVWDLLRCPRDPGSGALVHSGTEPGVLRCVQCGHAYPLPDGVPDLVFTAEPDLVAEARQWDEQAPRYEEGRARDLVYMAGVEAAVEALDVRPGELVLDAGCGTGLTVRQYCRPGVRVVALDLSPESLRRLRSAHDASAVQVVRGDLRSLPFADGTFDRVLCANALQQVPGVAWRQRVVQELARVARPGGKVVVTAHGLPVQKRLAGIVREGPAGGHSGRVRYIYRHAPGEFRGLLASALAVEHLGGAAFPLPYRLKLSPLSRQVERALRRVPAAAAWGNMLVAVCRKQ
jgi:SAM-dependent methyltransferase